jgi:hypothetical protein
VLVVFLDIDGVLNHQRLYDSLRSRAGRTTPSDWIDADCVARLDALCARTGARLVISSSWRTYADIPGQPVGGLTGTVAVLRSRGLVADVIGATPDHTTDEMRARQERAPRWPEIRAWLDARPGVSGYVAIDDCEIAAPSERFVRTSLAVGLTDNDCERAAEILGG